MLFNTVHMQLEKNYTNTFKLIRLSTYHMLHLNKYKKQAKVSASVAQQYS